MKKILVTAATTILLILPSATFSQDEIPPAAPATRPAAGQTASAPAQEDAAYRQQVSYVLGRNFAENLRDNEIEVDLKALMAGIGDLLQGAPPKWSDEQLKPAMQRFSQEMQQKAVARTNRVAAKNKQEADKFLAENAKRPGVQSTPSGLQYRVLRQADGPSPTLNDTVRCNYRGTLLNGTEFDNSARHSEPAKFTIAPGLIQGWIEALQKMHVGEKWQLFVPPNLAYGLDPQGPPIEPNHLLVFEIELLEIVPE